ncbi:MAG: histidinol dehydrogenase [Clostridia bacterium]|nr:histidinol dehydrogenase [Clostridia bacterium]
MIPIYEYAKNKNIAVFDRTDDAFDVSHTVSDIITHVKVDGDNALFHYCEKFDHVKLDTLEVSQAEIDEAFASVDADFIEILKEAAENIRAFHLNQVRTGFEMKKADGIVLGQRVLPLAKVGVYVPGGTASYPSTVLMNVIPAKLAGVGEIIMVSPPKADGKIKAEILAAAKIAGADRIFKVGGAQAVAALAYGTQSIPFVDKIVGPGNAFVAEAKKQVFGRVAIDMIAGPSEILVIADGKSNPVFVAADLLSQAEHDKFASPVLVTDSMALAEAVQKEIEIQLSQLPREEIARISVDTRGCILVSETIEEAVELSNRIAPEHLELCVDNPFEILPLVRAAGSVFLGRYCPEALGDYFAGPNHTLPTSGTARFSSPLSVDDFVVRSAYSYYTPEALGKIGNKVAVFANREGLDAHANSVLVRLKEMEQ